VLRAGLGVALVGFVTACADAPVAEPIDPNEGLLRDFLDGKFDAAGHPLNAKVIEAETVCGGGATSTGVRLSAACDGELPEGARSGEVTANVRLLVHSHPARGAIVTISLLDMSGELASSTLTVARLREGASWIDVPVKLQSLATAERFRIAPADGAVVEVDYIEIFPARFGLVVSPGSGVVADSDELTFELPRDRKLERLEANERDLLDRLDQLLTDGTATRTTTAFRTVISARVGDLLPERDEVIELHVRAGSDAARVQLRRTGAACDFEGDAAGAKVLVTGFQPFPADAWHDNISAVAVTAMNPAVLRDARVMRLVLPVEYDRAAAAIADVIARCEPDTVISFGQGGGAIALEQVAYNLQDTGEISGGVPDNRGVIRAAAQIDVDAPATRDTLLPLVEIRGALEAAGESPHDSTDPGRYICNNVMFQTVGTMASRGGRAGFIHLPYTSKFDDSVRARYGRVVEAAIQAAVDER
jgi:pyroglutamyl-peptidase